MSYKAHKKREKGIEKEESHARSEEDSWEANVKREKLLLNL